MADTDACSVLRNEQTGQDEHLGMAEHAYQHEAEASEELDNGFADPANTDVDARVAAQKRADSLTQSQQMAVLAEAVTRHPLNREIMYKMLVFCQEERSLTSLEQEVAAYPEFASCTQNPRSMARSLSDSFGLRTIERDAQGDEVTPERKEGLSEDEIDDLVSSLSFETTPVGRDFVEQHAPTARLTELLAFTPERADTYLELLSFVREAPRSYAEIQSLLANRPVLNVVIDGQPQTMQPSVFVDKLERTGVLVWDKGWTLTREGEEFLEGLLEKTK